MNKSEKTPDPFLVPGPISKNCRIFPVESCLLARIVQESGFRRRCLNILPGRADFDDIAVYELLSYGFRFPGETLPFAW